MLKTKFIRVIWIINLLSMLYMWQNIDVWWNETCFEIVRNNISYTHSNGMRSNYWQIDVQLKLLQRN